MLELVACELLLVLAPAWIADFVRILTRQELSEDPHDVTATTEAVAHLVRS